MMTLVISENLIKIATLKSDISHEKLKKYLLLKENISHNYFKIAEISNFRKI